MDEDLRTRIQRAAGEMGWNLMGSSIGGHKVLKKREGKAPLLIVAQREGARFQVWALSTNTFPEQEWYFVRTDRGLAEFQDYLTLVARLADEMGPIWDRDGF